MIRIIDELSLKLKHPYRSQNPLIGQLPLYRSSNRDNRLFPEDLLYCEGLERPLCRGFVHLFCAIIFPFVVWYLVIDSNGSYWGIIAAIAYGFSALFCYSVSSLYHIGRWSVKTEIILQKLDHCGIAIYAAGTNMPVSLLLLPKIWGASLGTLSVIGAMIVCRNIYLNKPSVRQLVLSSAVIVLFWPILWFHMNYIEFFGMLGCAVANGFGAAVFVNRYPNPWPDVFGYHEIFHIFTFLGGFSTFLCNWSVIHRTCNQYARYNDVIELLFLFWKKCFLQK
eukprot:gene15670-21195_t